jgi:hypothetical protein
MTHDSADALAHRGYRWMQSLLASAGSMRITPPLGGKWQAAYSCIGARPDRELEAVARFVLPHLRRGTLKERCVTPRHLVDYWQTYLDERLPFELHDSPSASAAHITPTADEYAADAARNPNWLTK